MPSPRLPRAARSRLARFETATAHPSFLTVPAAYGVRAAGFEAVGDVMGCLAFQTTTEYVGLCGYRGTGTTPRVTFPSGTGSSATSYLRQVTNAYRTALDRLRAEAAALRADGVLGVALELRRHDELREVVALGTAVRSTGRVRPDRPFLTDLPGTDVARLFVGGWTPVDLHVAVQLGLRHLDRQSALDASWSRTAANREVAGYTELRQRLTMRARDELRALAVRARSDGALLSGLDVEQWHHHCMSYGPGSDLVGLATATGTSVARFATASAPAPRPLSVLPVGRGWR
ncbi:heavy metal-binding domain-containing protein [Jatrophihabitans endophyticus]|uniref:heavy metal-binding domain-containing protein n=1 Tax=Jatrophihabitans endophyticus TaxID=1206085 RepID=UPI0019E1BBA5|nr:heavy metal-binding domain-containing protein [Jatrophihabitans endophyticus]MBE7189022.1 heavy metal-binding domain-containing protein [Jatrophihabitans endophyticus]